METLANIALATAKLEETTGMVESKRALGEDRLENAFETSFASQALQSRVVPHLPPPKQPFSAPRVVSIESSSSFKFDPAPSSKPEEVIGALEFAPKSDLDPPPPSPTPSDIITDILDDDVLCGRGGETNHAMGNVRYRALVKQHQRLYLKAKRRDKPKIARMIVDTVRSRGGRFLKKDPSSSTWRDVGNSKAREKTSQALREGAPELRTEESASSGDDIAVTTTTTTIMPKVVQTTERAAEPKKRKPQATDCFTLMNASLVSPTPSNTSLPVREFVGATVSADDDDSTGEQEQKKSFRGPRLAILKKRLSMSS